MKLLRLIAALILLPLCLSFTGLWELQRVTDRHQFYTKLQDEIQRARPQLSRLIASPERRENRIDIDGESMSIASAYSRFEEAANGLDTMVFVSTLMKWLAIGAAMLGLLAALVGACGLLALKGSGSHARRSRELLLRTFSRVRQILPLALVGHFATMGTAAAAILGFEALGIWHMGEMGAGELKIILVVLMVVAACLYSIWQMGHQLRVVLRMFEPTSMPIVGRVVTPEEAPVLWAYVGDLARRLGALFPDHIVLGVADGFYVTASDASVQPMALPLKGRTLHIPMIYLGVMDAAEISAVIGRELAHFAGEESEHSLRFLPIHEGIGRSLDVIAETITFSGLLQRTILRPALMLGIYFLESFDNAVNHWSRTRELAADMAAASLGGNAAAASALVRISAIQPLLQERLDVHMTYAMNSMSDRVMSKDLPTAVITELAGQPVTLPDNQLTFQLSHPSDTHPSNAERIVGLQAAADDAIRAGIRPIIAAHACAAMNQYFINPKAVRTSLTKGFIAYYVDHDMVIVKTLRT